MADNIPNTSGRPKDYKFDRGGAPAEMGPYIGIVVNNVDPTFGGKMQVAIEEFGAIDKDGLPVLTDTTLWRTVRYCPPFYGITQKTSTNTGAGTYPGNQQTYGMWFTPPDIGVKLICFFISGDPEQGYYVGCIPEPGINHMIPAIGSVSNYTTDNITQENYFSQAPLLPVTEINTTNPGVVNNPRFSDQPRPVHSFQASIFFQQGVDRDPERGPIGSSSQRETPSTVYGFSTPGQPIYEGGMKPNDIRKKLQSGELKPQDVKVIGRLGGHTLVMDDGDLEGNNSLLRLRTSKGHQIMMNDSGNFFHIMHANGQTWLEFGSEGTVDVFSTNSINMRTQGDINFHADKDINMYAGGNWNVKANAQVNLGSVKSLNIASEGSMTLFSSSILGLKADRAITMKSLGGSWDAGLALALKGFQIHLNSLPVGVPVSTPKLYPKTLMDDVTFNNSTGWKVKPSGLESIVSRAPTHEPYSYHNEGVNVSVSLEPDTPTPPPGAEPVPDGWSIKVK